MICIMPLYIHAMPHVFLIFPKGGSCCAHVVDIRFLNDIFPSWLLTIMLGLSTLDMPIALLVDLNS